MNIRGYAAYAAKENLRALEYTPATIGDYDVRVKISHCGICHTDLHLIDNDWGVTEYPNIPGHEIIGIIEAAGPKSTRTVGQRVGIGWQRSACGSCEHCLQGLEQFCNAMKTTCIGNHGGFADAIVIDGRFTFPIPDALTSENAAPLLCAGITVYDPLIRAGVKKGSKVGVIGIGGLGHLALQFARAMGAQVTAFSTSSDKAVEARSFGADHFVSTSDRTAFDAQKGALDFILSTVPADIDWSAYVTLLKPFGTLCIVGPSPSPISVHSGALIGGSKSISGSMIGSRKVMLDMLAFAAAHGIVAKTETVPMAQVNAALDKVRANQARYRMVLKA
jgi:alcohol/geraniol dehydrogenase (NADP+)